VPLRPTASTRSLNVPLYHLPRINIEMRMHQEISIEKDAASPQAAHLQRALPRLSPKERKSATELTSPPIPKETQYMQMPNATT
jgi:hypothetical protein